MRLPEDDEEYLRTKGYTWELVPEGDGACLILQGYPVSPELYDRAITDLMVRIPAQYNNAALDMFYCDPLSNCGTAVIRRQRKLSRIM